MIAAVILSLLATVTAFVVLRGRSGGRSVHLVGIGLGIVTTTLVTLASALPPCSRTDVAQRQLELAIVAAPASACVGVLAYVIALLTERGRDTWRFGLTGLALSTAVPVIIVWYQLNFGHWAGWMECDP